MSTLPSMALIPCQKPWKDSFSTLSTNLGTLFRLAPNDLYGTSSFRSLAMLLMICKIISYISLPNSLFPPQIQQISSKHYEEGTRESNVSVVAGGQSSRAWLLHAKLLKATFGLVSFDQLSTIQQLYEDLDNPRFSFHLTPHGTNCLCSHPPSSHHQIPTVLLIPHTVRYSHDVYCSINKASVRNRCHQKLVPRLAKKTVQRP